MIDCVSDIKIKNDNKAHKMQQSTQPRNIIDKWW